MHVFAEFLKQCSNPLQLLRSRDRATEQRFHFNFFEGPGTASETGQPPDLQSQPPSSSELNTGEAPGRVAGQVRLRQASRRAHASQGTRPPARNTLPSTRTQGHVWDSTVCFLKPPLLTKGVQWKELGWHEGGTPQGSTGLWLGPAEPPWCEVPVGRIPRKHSCKVEVSRPPGALSCLPGPALE